jgi:6-phosphogluconolactonase
VQIKSFPTAAETAAAAARYIQGYAVESIDSRGSFKCAFSGGKTPWVMLEHLSRCAVPWQKCHLFQVDERVTPAGDDSRNLSHIQGNLINRACIPASSIHPMPVECDSLTDSAREYEHTLISICGDPPILDLVLLGLGTDGHTASLIPGDPVLKVKSKCVGLTGEYHGVRRMTLTFPTLNAARIKLWLVTGKGKADILKAFLENDLTFPASGVSKDEAIVFADDSAMSNLAQNRA